MWLRRLILILTGIGLCAGGLALFAAQAVDGYRAGDMEAIAGGLFVGGLLGFAGIFVIIAGMRWTAQRQASRESLKGALAGGQEADRDGAD